MIVGNRILTPELLGLVDKLRLVERLKEERVILRREIRRMLMYWSKFLSKTGSEVYYWYRCISIDTSDIYCSFQNNP